MAGLSFIVVTGLNYHFLHAVVKSGFSVGLMGIVSAFKDYQALDIGKS